MQCGQQRMRGVRIRFADGVEVDCPGTDRLADFLDRFDLGIGQAKPLELVGARQLDGVVVERIEGGKQPLADRRRARHRQLLAADDGTQAGITTLAPAQVEGPGGFRDWPQARVELDQLDQAGVEVALGMKEMGHTSFSLSCPRKRASSPSLK